MITSIFLKGLPIHNSWKLFFEDPVIIKMLLDIEEQVTSDEYTPLHFNVLRFAKADLMNVNCAVWGRDPYPQVIKEGHKKGEYVATGRAFEVNGIQSWDEKLNASLQNILKLLHKSFYRLEKVAPIKTVRDSINNDFNILPPNQVFDYWEQEGVLFLNRSFTCRVGNQSNDSGSHEAIWNPFFYELLKYMVDNNPEIKHFLWGKAKDLAPVLLNFGVVEENLYLSNHPSARQGDSGGFERDSGFFQNPCFKETGQQINWIKLSKV